MSDDEDRGRTDLIQAILRVLPVDPDDGTTVTELRMDEDAGAPWPIWGDPRVLARRILDALDEAYTSRELQHEWNYMGQVEREEPF